MLNDVQFLMSTLRQTVKLDFMIYTDMVKCPESHLHNGLDIVKVMNPLGRYCMVYTQTSIAGNSKGLSNSIQITT